MALPLDPVLDAKAASCKHILYNYSSVLLDDIKKNRTVQTKHLVYVFDQNVAICPHASEPLQGD